MHAATLPLTPRKKNKIKSDLRNITNVDTCRRESCSGAGRNRGNDGNGEESRNRLKVGRLRPPRDSVLKSGDRNGADDGIATSQCIHSLRTMSGQVSIGIWQLHAKNAFGISTDFLLSDLVLFDPPLALVCI